jgi:hypothetical protein
MDLGKKPCLAEYIKLIIGVEKSHKNAKIFLKGSSLYQTGY